MQITLGNSQNSLEKPPDPKVAVSFEPNDVRRVFIHQDFEEWFSDPATSQSYQKKSRFHIKNLLTRGYCPGSKSVVGPAKGWLRASLGGSGGFHFYLWYVNAGSEIGASLGLESGQFAVRIVRHHNDTSLTLEPGSLSDDYMDFTPSDVEGNGDVYSVNQKKIAMTNTGSVQTLRGYPGSGKTTSLLLSASHSASNHILYITYSESLAREAKEHFDIFKQSGTFIDVMTFPELLHHLADDRDDANKGRSPIEAARRLDELLPRMKNMLEGWNGHINELYAELHAHGVGRALPLDFRGSPSSANESLSNEEFVTMRRDDLGQEMAKTAGRILEWVSEKNYLMELFPGPTKAHRLICDIHEPPTERLLNVGTVLIDEIQDLTQIEVLFLLNLIARIGTDSGIMPRVMLAGDESQTVRPTDFQWSWLKDLLTTVFGKDVEFEDTALDQNLRSPPQIAKFVEATRAQYSKFDKEDRPSGISYTEMNDDLKGRLMYCAVDTPAEWNQLVEIFGKIPRSRLVYPGFTVPIELEKLTIDKSRLVTADDVKGLDFDVVGVIDAGFRQEELGKLLERKVDSPFVSVFGRTLADQYRVAASRASEKLVLIDRDGRNCFDQVAALCKSRNNLDLDLEQVTVSQLAQILEEDLDQESLIRSLIDDVKRTIDDQPERALLVSRSISKQFETLERLSLIPEDLRYEVFRIRGVVALVGLLRGLGKDASARENLVREAENALSQVNLGAVFESVQKLATLTESWSSETYIEVLLEGVQRLSEVERELPEVRRWHTNKIVAWMDDLEKAPRPNDDGPTIRVIDTATILANVLTKEYDYLEGLVQKTCVRWADQALGDRKPKTALKILEKLTIRDHNREADCYLKDGQLVSASESFELAGNIEAAISATRQIPDIERALELARRTNSDDLPTLEWLNDAKALFDNRSTRSVGNLTDAESETLIDWAKRK